MAAAASCDVTAVKRFINSPDTVVLCRQFRVSINVKTTRFNARLIKR